MPNTTPASSPTVSSTIGLKNVVIAPLTADTETGHTYGGGHAFRVLHCVLDQRLIGFFAFFDILGNVAQAHLFKRLRSLNRTFIPGGRPGADFHGIPGSLRSFFSDLRTFGRNALQIKTAQRIVTVDAIHMST